jgi:hypothetical protein
VIEGQAKEMRNGEKKEEEGKNWQNGKGL